MKAVVFDGKSASYKEHPSPQRRRGEAVVKVHLAGVCSTDLEILKGYMNFRGVMGHEFVGRVADGPKRWMDKRVVAEINCVCGRCEVCRRGLANHCPNRTVLGIDGRDGVFAEYVAVPVRNLHHVPRSVSNEQAVMVEPLAAAFEIIEQVRPDRRRHKVVVLGDGRMGQLISRVLRPHAKQMLLVGRHREKLQLAERQSISTAHVDDFAPAGDADLVVEATGSTAGINLAIGAVRPRGTIVLKSTTAGGEELNLAPVVVNEVTIVGSRCGPFERATDALKQGRVEVTDLITARFPLAEAVTAMQAAKKPDEIKVLLDVES